MYNNIREKRLEFLMSKRVHLFLYFVQNIAKLKVWGIKFNENTYL